MESSAMAAPQSLAEVEQLVKVLYTPGNPEVIHQVERQLQALQHTPEGWQMAERLLESDDGNVKFFGALTYTVKINTGGDELSEEDFASLQSRLIFWLGQFLARSESRALISKLSTALVSCVLHPAAPESDIIKLVVRALNSSEQSDASINPASLTTPQTSGVLGLISMLAEEADRRENHAAPLVAANMHKRMERNMQDAVELMRYGTSATGTDIASSQLRQASVTAFGTWVFYANKVWYRQPEVMAPLRTLIHSALQCCTLEDHDTTVIDQLTDVLGASGGFFEAEHLRAVAELLTGEWGHKELLGLMSDPEPTNISCARLLLGYGDADLDNIITKPNDPVAVQIMEMMHYVLKTPGYPGEEDDLSIEAISFWNTLTEYVVEASTDRNSASSWIEYAKQHVVKLVEEIWHKARYPPPSETTKWDSDQKKAFQDWRVEINELLLYCHTILGTGLLQGFSGLCLDALQRKEWLEVEASLFCINSLSDALSEDEHEDEVLAQIFRSSLFADLASRDDTIPSRVRRTAVDLLGSYDQFIVRRTEFLPSALNFLFSALEAAYLATTAARSISLLCSTCRKSLVSELPAFFIQYEHFITWPTSDIFTKGKVIGAIASIAQALETEEAKHAGLNKLLDFIDVDVHQSLTSMASGQVDESRAAGVAALSSLASVGIAFQAPGEIPIDLDANPEEPNYWNDGAGAEAQRRITQLIGSVTDILGNDGDVIQEACNALKSGLRESTPGPFVLRPRVIIDFIERTTVQTPRLEAVLAVSCSLLSGHTPETSRRIDNEASALIKYINGLFVALGNPRTDPEISQACIDVLTRFIPRYINALLGQDAQILELILMFTIQAIRIPEPLPKKAACKFWAALLALPQTLHPTLDPIITHFGPPLSHTLIFGLGGEAARSDLDALCDPLKKLVTRTPQARGWLEQALLSPAFPSRRVKEQDKKTFLMKVVAERGGAMTKAIAEEFWGRSRGRVLGMG